MKHFLPMFSMVASLFLSEPAKGGEFDRSDAEEYGQPWQTDQPGFKPNLTYPIFYTLALQSVSIACLGSLDQDSTGFTGPSWGNFQDAYTKGPRWDDDGWYWNYISHPFLGSEIYLRARAQGCTPLGSFLFSATASVVWEFGIESWYERPSNQDLIITPVAGSLIGEVRFRAKRALLEADTIPCGVLAVIIDPLQSGAQIIGRAFGQDWSEPAFRKMPACAGQSWPVFSMDLAHTGGRPSLSFHCRMTF